MKNTYQELELNNGEVVKLTLNFARLLKIKNDREVLYNRLMRILQASDIDVISDSLTVIYVAYLCANLDIEVLSEDDFIELVPFDLEKINVIAGKLIMGNKKKIGFQESFKKVTKKVRRNKKIKTPKIILEDIEDYYTYFVLILNINETLFWSADLSFLLKVLENKNCYDNYINYLKDIEYNND